MPASLKEILKITTSSWSGFSALIDINRKIHFINPSFFTKNHINPESLEGLYLDEVIGCSLENSSEKKICGTLDLCSYCGIYKAVQEAFDSRDSVRKEASISFKRNGQFLHFFLNVLAQPFHLPEGDFLLLTLEDVTAQRRKNSLERAFYHDILNTVASLTMNINIMEESETVEDFRTHLKSLEHITDNLTDEIQRQRLVGLAESGKLEVSHSLISVKDFLNEVLEYFEEQSIKREKHIKIEGNDDCIFVSDKMLVRRVLVNLIKNALEAVPKGEGISLSYKMDSGFLIINVSNSGFIEQEGQHLIFHQFYSTKGPNRGLGTYSVKLITENILKGEAYFTTSKSDNLTVFTIKLPDLRGDDGQLGS